MPHTIYLRGHHLLCSLTYIGLGYNEGFTAHYDGVVEKLNKGAVIIIADGPDEICQSLNSSSNPHEHWKISCLGSSTQDRDHKALEAISSLLGQSFHIGKEFTLTADLVDRLRQAFRAGNIRTACLGCQWYEACTGIAVSGYDGVKLYPDKV